ncbi:MAG: hypothetical protein R2705_10310 [Ilumatobacteraceae bacterium]
MRRRPRRSVNPAAAGLAHLAERAGQVRLLRFAHDGSVVDDGVVIDLSGRHHDRRSNGLLGLAVAADGSELYVSSTDTSGATKLEAYARHRRVPTAPRTLFQQPQPYGKIHNGGGIEIAPDGSLVPRAR